LFQDRAFHFIEHCIVAVDAIHEAYVAITIVINGIMYGRLNKVELAGGKVGAIFPTDSCKFSTENLY